VRVMGYLAVRQTPQHLAAVLIAAILAWPVPAAAAAMTLDDVVRVTLGGGAPAVQQEDAKVRSAEGEVRQAAGAFDWNFSAQSGWERLYFPESSGGFLTTQLETADTWHTTVGVSRLFRSGISIEPGISVYDAPAGTTGRTLGLTRTRPTINLSIPLLRGGENNSAATNEKAAQINLEGVKLERNFVAQRALVDAVQVYWRCLAAQRQLEIVAGAARQADSDAAMLRDSVAHGAAEPAAMDRAVATQAVQQVALGRAQNVDAQCRRDLGVATGTADSTAAGDLPTPEGRAAAIAQLNETVLLRQALRDRRDLQAMSNFLVAQNDRVLGARNNTEPKVDLFLDTTRAMVRLSVPIGGDTQKGLAEQAAAGQTEARINLQQLQGQIRRDTGDAVGNLRLSAAYFEALKHSQSLLEGVVADAARRLQAGTITREQYRQDQEELDRVRPQVIDAQLQFASTLADLHLVLGAIPVGPGVSAPVVAAMLRSLPGDIPR
jgi:outer membrane protein TolC